MTPGKLKEYSNYSVIQWPIAATNAPADLADLQIMQLARALTQHVALYRQVAI